MVEYIDSSGGCAEDALGNWLQENLVAGTRCFRCQSGYFGLGSLRDHLDTLGDVEELRIVLGSNHPGEPTAEDIRELLPLLTDPKTRTLTMVGGSSGALFHPKTIHMVGPDGTATGYVGSANLTEKGLGKNIEAGVLLGPEDEGALNSMAAAIDKWAELTDAGVHQVRGEEEITDLLKKGILVTASAQRGARAAVQKSLKNKKTRKGLKTKLLWRPTTGKPAAQAVLEGEMEATAEAGKPDESVALVPHLRWCKKLPRNDAQQPSNPNSNVRGIIGLNMAGFDISAATYFREKFFGFEKWVDAGAKEECHVTFTVDFPGRTSEKRALRVSHNPSREAKQGNISTHLHWGPDLMKWLRANSQVGNWGVLERHEDGTYSLAITEECPGWAP